MSDLSSAEESDEDKGKNKISIQQMKTTMAGMKLEEPCVVCKKTVFKADKNTIDVGGKLLHPGCFKCCQCNFSLTLKTFKTDAGKYYCNPHYPKFRATQALDQTTELAVKSMQTTESLKRFEGVTRKADPKQLAAEREHQEKINQNAGSWEAQRQARLEADRDKLSQQGQQAYESAQAASARNASDLAKQREEREAARGRQAESGYSAPASSAPPRAGAGGPSRAMSPPSKPNPTPAPKPSAPTPSAPKPSGPGPRPMGGPPPKGPGGPAPPGPRAPVAPRRPPTPEPEPEPEPEPYREPEPEPEPYHEPEPEPEPEPYYQEPEPEPEPEPERPPARAPPRGPAPPGRPKGPKYPVGSTCLCLYPADGGFYPAVVTSIEDGQYYITYTEYDEAGGPFGEEDLKPE